MPRRIQESMKATNIFLALFLPVAAGWNSMGARAVARTGTFSGSVPALCHFQPGTSRDGVRLLSAQQDPQSGEDQAKQTPSADSDAEKSARSLREKSAVMEEKLARWRAQAEALRLQDKDSAVSRARASQLSRESSGETEEAVINNEIVGGPRGSARRTVVERMRELKISESRAELSADIQQLREQEEFDEQERKNRLAAREQERKRIETEIEENAKVWAEKKFSYWKEGLDSERDMPVPDRAQRVLALDRLGIEKRPTESITAKLNEWKDMSAARKARQLGSASVDLGVTVMNAAAILIGIILQKPVDVPATSFRGESIRAKSESLSQKMIGALWGRRSNTPPPSGYPKTPPPPAQVPSWTDLGVAVDEMMYKSSVAGMSDVRAEYEEMADEETEYLQQNLRQKWRARRNRTTPPQGAGGGGEAAPYAPSEAQASASMKTLIAQDDFGGVRGLLRDTIQASEVHQVLLGFKPSPSSSDPPPLLQAAAQGRADIVEALRDAGANMRVVDTEGRTASQVAEAAGHKELAKKLITWSATQG